MTAHRPRLRVDLLCLAMTLFACPLAAAAAEKPAPKKYDYSRFKTAKRPNVLLVMTDDKY